MPLPLPKPSASLTRRLVLGAATAALAAAGAGAQAAELNLDQATSFVDKVGRELMAAVNGPGSTQEKAKALQAIIDRAVDVDQIGRFCLGRFWRQASAQQQKDYIDLFHRVLVLNITSKVGDYQGVSLVVNKAAPREDGVAVTTTVTRPNNAPNRVDWLVAGDGGNFRIIDVIAEGTSLRLTQRNDYTAYLARNNNEVQALLDALRKQASGAAG